MSQKILAGVLLIIGAILVGAVLQNSMQDGPETESNSDSDESEQTQHPSNYSGENHSLAYECLDSHSNLDEQSQHFHPSLSIYIDGQLVSIPENTGIGTAICDGMHVIHTHDSSGKLHVETSEPVDVELGVFFQIWDVYFAADGIGDKRINETHELVMTVNDVEVETYGDHILANGEQIVIDYRVKA